VQEYYRGWESVGLKEFKQVIPSQLVHSLAVVYLVDTDHGSLSSSMEVQNLSDEDVYDFFGVQRPGRAFYAKMTFEL
jgi:vitamin B12 transporter